MNVRTLVAATVAICGTVGATGPALAQSVVQDGKCDCAVFPWKPDACVKECTTKFVMVPADFERLLKPAPDVMSSVRALKARDAPYAQTYDRIDSFLESPSGDAFLKTVETAKPSDLKSLAEVAAKTKGPG